MIRVAFIILFVTLIMSIAVGHRVSKKLAWAFVIAACIGSGLLAYIFMGAGVNASGEQDTNAFIDVIYAFAPGLVAFLPLGIAGLWHASRRDDD